MMFDDAPVPTVVPPSPTGGYVPGLGPGHLQNAHARTTRARIAMAWPDSIQRTGPARHTKADTPPAQTYPTLASTDHINVDEALGVETAHRSGQAPLAGWDGEFDAFTPDWAQTSIW